MIMTRIGEINVFDSVVVECEDEKFVLQVLNNEGESPVCMRYWIDETTGETCQGIFIPDSVELFNADPEILKITRLTCIPAWMKGVYVDPVQFITSDCIEVE